MNVWKIVRGFLKSGHLSDQEEISFGSDNERPSMDAPALGVKPRTQTEIFNPEIETAPIEGTVKYFGPNDRRRLAVLPMGERRWVNDDDYEQIQKLKQKISRELTGRQKYITGYYKYFHETSSKFARGFDKLGRRHWLKVKPKHQKEFDFTENVDKDHRQDDQNQKSAVVGINKSIPQVTMSGINFNGIKKSEKGNKPKYKRRYKTKHGKWVYIFEDHDGTQFEADQKGKKIERHESWKKGESVYHNHNKHTIEEMSENYIAATDGKNKKVMLPLHDVEHEDERQIDLLSQKQNGYFKKLSEEFDKHIG